MIVGIDLGGTSVSLGQFSNGKLIQKVSTPSPSDKDLQDSLVALKNTIKLLMNPKVKGIGIGVPSVVDTQKGIVYNAANISSWKEVYLKDVLEEEFNVPVFINNDANCFALGEREFGEGAKCENMIGITLGTGLGAGLIINNELYNGRNTGAGEIGSIPYLDGIYEDYCASNFFETYYKTTGKEVFKKAQKGSEKALDIWDEFGKHMGNLIQTTLFAYDPDVIVLGGSISNAYQYFEKSMWKSIRNFPYPESLNNLEIKVSRNPEIAILGAAALVKL